MSGIKPVVRRSQRLSGCEVNGEFRTVRDWAKELGIGEATLRHRILAGWSYEKIISTPPKPRGVPRKAV